MSNTFKLTSIFKLPDIKPNYEKNCKRKSSTTINNNNIKARKISNINIDSNNKNNYELNSDSKLQDKSVKNSSTLIGRFSKDNNISNQDNHKIKEYIKPEDDIKLNNCLNLVSPKIISSSFKVERINPDQPCLKENEGSKNEKVKIKKIDEDEKKDIFNRNYINLNNETINGSHNSNNFINNHKEKYKLNVKNKNINNKCENNELNNEDFQGNNVKEELNSIRNSYNSNAKLRNNKINNIVNINKLKENSEQNFVDNYESINKKLLNNNSSTCRDNTKKNNGDAIISNNNEIKFKEVLTPELKNNNINSEIKEKISIFDDKEKKVDKKLSILIYNKKTEVNGNINPIKEINNSSRKNIEYNNSDIIKNNNKSDNVNNEIVEENKKIKMILKRMTKFS
ncbi:hypothetical protein LY90DRAFT_519239 [Neocallimastix californiae]|uniref:Uncharacterized protein n=1 Tax=Neocallimastix californiae TaxID=1754190 RepID=A0A1Y1Z7D7_9FUNG|nr:hypothetical protein LY90DRAFT_519239 [Neocallimastix californiae]|eukprot:ORY06163.1 hypothetical protein LY90DRAFT_519239 [Neocallimastix californiae]